MDLLNCSRICSLTLGNEMLSTYCWYTWSLSWWISSNSFNWSWDRTTDGSWYTFNGALQGILLTHLFTFSFFGLFFVPISIWMRLWILLDMLSSPTRQVGWDVCEVKRQHWTLQVYFATYIFMQIERARMHPRLEIESIQFKIQVSARSSNSSQKVIEVRTSRSSCFTKFSKSDWRSWSSNTILMLIGSLLLWCLEIPHKANPMQATSTPVVGDILVL